MDKKIKAVELIQQKLNNETFLTYKDIAKITDYHEKYILKLKKEILTNTISLEHKNKNKTPINKISDQEKKFIIDLYKRSNCSILQFKKFYDKRSYSCIYKLLKDENII